MDSCKSELNQKRQQVDENCSTPQQKIQRLLVKSRPSISSDQPMKITDLDDACLEKIFGHLDLRGTFNVAVANEWLRPAAGVVFKREFGLKEIRIVASKNPSNTGLEPYTSNDVIYVTGLKMCLQFLRCLGSSISYLNIRYYGWNIKHCEHLHQYINNYCAERLENIELWDKSNKNPIKHFEKPFINVHTVKVCCSYLGVQFALFAQWFPNMRSLELNDIYKLSPIKVHFPHLEALYISIEDNGELGRTKKKANSLLRLHPELHSLEIRTSKYQTMDTLLNIIKPNRVICNLTMKMFWFGSVINLLDIDRLTTEHPSLVELELVGFKISSTDVIILISQLESLKKFRIQIANRLEYDRLVSQLADNKEWRPSLRVLGNYVVTLERLS